MCTTIAVGLGMVSSASAGDKGSRLLEGRWGGDRLQMVIDASGARLEADCASGSIAGPIRLGPDGKFTARGAFRTHAPGPTPADEPPQASNAIFTGTLRDGALQLTVAPAGAPPQHFALRQGVSVKLVRCY